MDDATRRLAREGLRASSWSNGPGDRYAAHAHGYDKVLVVAAGSIVFELPHRNAAFELQVGDRLDLPAGYEHAAVVGGLGVTCLEAHLPRRSIGEVRHHRRWAAETDGRRQP